MTARRIDRPRPPNAGSRIHIHNTTDTHNLELPLYQKAIALVLLLALVASILLLAVVSAAVEFLGDVIGRRWARAAWFPQGVEEVRRKRAR